MSELYSNPLSFPYIERAVLVEDVKLPVYNKKKKLKRHFFYNLRNIIDYENRIYADRYNESELNNEYKLAYNELKNIDALFYIPKLMPTIEESDVDVSIKRSSPSKKGFKGDNINSSSYIYSNSVSLTIPKYILLQFIDNKTETEGLKDPYIPKGTEFLICCIGGIMDIEKMRIIGLYTLDYDHKSFPELKDSYYGGNPVK